MLKKYALEYCKIGQQLKALEMYLESVVQGHGNELYDKTGVGINPNSNELLGAVVESCKAMGLCASQKKAEYIMKYAYEALEAAGNRDDLGRVISKVSNQFGMLQELIVAELEAEHFFRIERGNEKFYVVNQFPANVQEKFSSTVFDMEEAGKCFALERYSACVFHLMRIVDACLKRLGKEYRIKPTNPNWNEYIVPLQNKVKTLKGKNRDKALKLNDVIETIKSVSAMRNHLAHSDELLSPDSIHRVEIKYTQEEAERHLKNVKALTEAMLRALSVQKKP